MKRRDLIYLSVAIAVLVTAGILLMSTSGAGSDKSKVPTYEVIEPIEAEYDQVILAEIADSKLHRNFAVPVNLKTELGNKNPFGN